MDPTQSGGDWTHALFVREFEKRERQGAIESSAADYSAAAVQRKGQLANFVRIHKKKQNWSALYVPCSCINRCIFLKRPTNAPPCMNVILLHSNHRHVPATHIWPKHSYTVVYLLVLLKNSGLWTVLMIKDTSKTQTTRNWNLLLISDNLT